MLSDALHKRLDGWLEEATAARRLPHATYRIQFSRDFGFADATGLVNYLYDLGISDLYASPLFASRAGSTHGYDVCDPTRLEPDLGPPEAFDELVSALRQQGMGLVLDVVPNHMGIDDPCNVWWWDVLENGPSSLYASFFDVQWKPVKEELTNRVLLPILEAQYGAVLEAGKLWVEYRDGAFVVVYADHLFPVAPRSYALILQRCLEKLGAAEEAEPAIAPPVIAEQEDEAVLELRSILTAVEHLPQQHETEPARRLERAREKESVKRRLAALSAESADVRTALEQALRSFRGEPGEPHSFDALDALLEAQVYRLAYWRVAGEEINYRRFFDINDLAAIRVEDENVFEATHGLALDLAAAGKVTGLRIDHPDGLYDPAAYFRRLQAAYLWRVIENRLTEGEADAARAYIDAWLERRAAEAPAAERWPLYVVAEKILSETEPLPTDWAVYGTTGYDFLNAANGLFVGVANRKTFDRLYTRFAPPAKNFAELTRETRRLIMREALTSEISALSYELERISERRRHFRDFTLNGIGAALREVVASLPVYRTYVNAHAGFVSERDRHVIKQAVRTARRRRPGLDASLFDYLEEILLLKNLAAFEPEERAMLEQWIMKLQQLTGPIMAKGIEDTAFYRYYRLASLNEVGGTPAQFGVSVEDFHHDNLRRANDWPASLLAGSTHDHKRSEDVRARINVLSEMPDRWRKALARWSRLVAGKKTRLDELTAPSRNDEYLLYQTLLGAWPLAADAGKEGAPVLAHLDGAELEEFGARIAAYMEKATKEAKEHTSWLNSDEQYDAAVRRFTEALLDPASRRFAQEFRPLAEDAAYFGLFNSLSQLVLRLTSPGAPDIYQGTEMWDFSLVDPDNRRPVDYGLRRAVLAEMRERTEDEQMALAGELLDTIGDGRIKLYVIQRTLAWRRSQGELLCGEYIPLETSGPQAAHLCAYLRRDGKRSLIAVVPRLIYSLTSGRRIPPVGETLWGETWLHLPNDLDGALKNLYTGERVTPSRNGSGLRLAAGAALASFPAAALTTST